MASLPYSSDFDSTLALRASGYTFVSEQSRCLRSNLFQTRFALQPATCLLGRDAAETFYEPDRLTRRGAIPPTAVRLLQDRGSVQQLSGDAFDFIPQGGGDVATTHRCPGEWITIALMKSAVALLTGAMRYTVPPQDLRIDLRRFPTLPNSRFVIEDVRAVP